MDESKRDEFYDLCSNRLESVRLTHVENEEVSFTSKVYFIDEKKIELTFKKVKGEFPEIKPEDKLDFKGALSDGKQLLCYVTVKIVRKSVDSSKPSILEVHWPDDFAKKQMRQDVRVRAAVKILFTGELDENRHFPEDKISSGILSDISRGGCFVLTRDKIIYKGKPIFLYIYVKNDQDEIVINTVIPGRVVVVKSIGNDKSVKCQGMAVNFLNMSKQTEDKLVNWIFEEQRKQLAVRRSQ
tara:strand:+ start:1820 stop:2542 length:723 start_codon:yes stop_codon:yes gene_type:complete